MFIAHDSHKSMSAPQSIALYGAPSEKKMGYCSINISLLTERFAGRFTPELFEAWRAGLPKRPRLP